MLALFLRRWYRQTFGAKAPARRPKSNRPYLERLEVRWVPGAVAFSSAVNITTGTAPLAVVVADVNGDGKPDLVVANSGSNNVSVFLGNGNGTFQAAQNFTTGMDPRSVVVADVNGDGKPDLVVTDYYSLTVA